MEQKKYIAIGDIHGRYHSLRTMIDYLMHEHSDATLVFLGDYVDRGQFSANVIDAIIDLKEKNIFRSVIPLCGNHEQMFLASLHKPNSRLAEHWARKCGGYNTLFSYGWDFDMGYDFSVIPESHISFLNELKYYHKDKNVFFCHAGVNPDRKLNDQKNEDLIWIREKFLESNKVWKKLIVHGHTQLRNGFPAVDKSNRLNLDIGAARMENIACAVIKEGEPVPEIIIATDKTIEIVSKQEKYNTPKI